MEGMRVGWMQKGRGAPWRKADAEGMLDPDVELGETAARFPILNFIQIEVFLRWQQLQGEGLVVTNRMRDRPHAPVGSNDGSLFPSTHCN